MLIKEEKYRRLYDSSSFCWWPIWWLLRDKVFNKPMHKTSTEHNYNRYWKWR